MKVRLEIEGYLIMDLSLLGFWAFLENPPKAEKNERPRKDFYRWLGLLSTPGHLTAGHLTTRYLTTGDSSLLDI